VVRPDLDGAESLLRAVSAVDWSAVHHAYGAASDVPGQLPAVIVGDEETRDEAWWNLRGNIRHQGTIYAATASDAVVALEDWVHSDAD
jgi:hypothetical protein